MALKRIWFQTFFELDGFPDYRDALQAHIDDIVAPGTEVVCRGAIPGTFASEYPGVDIRFRVLQQLHALQFLLAGIAAEEQGFDAFAISPIPDPGLMGARSLISIPVVAYGESAMMAALSVGRRFGVILFIDELAAQIEENVAAYGLRDRFVGTARAGCSFQDISNAFEDPGPLLNHILAAGRSLIAAGADVVIPGEMPISLLLARNGVRRIGEVPVINGTAVTIKRAEMMIELGERTGLATARTGYDLAQPPRERVRELISFYGLDRLAEDFSTQPTHAPISTGTKK